MTVTNGLTTQTVSTPYVEAARLASLAPGLPFGTPECKALGQRVVVAFKVLKYNLDKNDKKKLRKIAKPGCGLVVTGYVQPTPNYGNDHSLSLNRAESVHRYLMTRIPARNSYAKGGRRDHQKLCKGSQNRCEIVKVEQVP